MTTEIQGRPHPVFAALWGAWLAAVIVGVLLPERALYGLVALLVGAVIEAVGVIRRKQARDTLSEITTWVNRKLSKHGKPLQGWNSLVAIQAVLIGRLLYTVLYHYSGAQAVALIVSVLFALGQHAHWLHPETTG